MPDMVIATIVISVFGLLALWTLISPGSVYWALTAWQYKDPDANEPSDAAYAMSRAGALVTLIVLAVVGFQATGWQSEAQAREDCKTVLLPALREVLRKRPVAPPALEDFARVHDLTLKTSTLRLPTYQTPRRTVSPTASPSKSGTPTEKPTAKATPTPSPTTTSRPTTTTRATTSRPKSTSSTTSSTYEFQRGGKTVLTWTDGATFGPNPGCKA